MALDALTIVTIIGFVSGLMFSSYILYVIVFVMREEYHMPVMFMGGCWLICINWLVGAHWDFLPETFPRKFCIASALLYNFGAFCMTSTGLTLCITTFNAVNAARQRRFDTISRPWAIPPRMKIFFYAYPCLAIALFASLALSFDAIGPEGKWICDITRKDYLWIRLFGYGGIDVLATVPAFIASCMTMRILYTIHTDASIVNDIQEHFRIGDKSEAKVSPNAYPMDDEIRISLSSPASSPMASPRSQPWSIAPTPHMAKVRFPHGQADSSSTHDTGSEVTHSTRTRAELIWNKNEDKVISYGHPNRSLGHAADFEHVEDAAALNPDSRRPRIAFTTNSRRLHHAPGPDIWESEATIETSSSIIEVPNGAEEVTQKWSIPVVKPDFKGALFRILWMDFLFTGIEALAAVSSLKAVTTNKPPSGYDTAFAAVVCASWGPVLVFFSVLPIWRKLL